MTEAKLASENAIWAFAACSDGEGDVAVVGASDQIANAHWFKTWRNVLRDDPDGVGKVIRSLRYHLARAKGPTSREALRRELNYFAKNGRRMHCAELGAKKLAIGSGAVEAASKTLAAQRMK